MSGARQAKCAWGLQVKYLHLWFSNDIVEFANCLDVSWSHFSTRLHIWYRCHFLPKCLRQEHNTGLVNFPFTVKMPFKVSQLCVFVLTFLCKWQKSYLKNTNTRKKKPLVERREVCLWCPSGQSVKRPGLGHCICLRREQKFTWCTSIGQERHKPEATPKVWMPCTFILQICGILWDLSKTFSFSCDVTNSEELENDQHANIWGHQTATVLWNNSRKYQP